MHPTARWANEHFYEWTDCRAFNQGVTQRIRSQKTTGNAVRTEFPSSTVDWWCCQTSPLKDNFPKFSGRHTVMAKSRMIRLPTTGRPSSMMRWAAISCFLNHFLSVKSEHQFLHSCPPGELPEASYNLSIGLLQLCVMANPRDTQGPVDWKKTALLVIDMQNDFILPGRPRCVAGGAAIVPAVKEAVAVAREKGALVVWVVREHDPYGRDAELFRRHFYWEGNGNQACKGTKGAELVEGLIIQEGDYKLVKTRFSAFFGTNLHCLLQGAGISSVVAVGVQTPNCIRQTVFDAVALDYSPIIVLADATAAATPEIHSANLFDMRNVAIETPTLAAWSGKDVK